MFGIPSWKSIALVALVLAFIAGMYALGAKDLAALGGIVGVVVAAMAKTREP